MRYLDGALAMCVIGVLAWFIFLGGYMVRQTLEDGRALMTTSEKEKENSWGFGQNIAVLALWILLLQLVESGKCNISACFILLFGRQIC